MKYVSQCMVLIVSTTFLTGTLSADQAVAPTTTVAASVTSEDVSQLFDGDDALDHVTIDDCAHPSTKDSLDKKSSAFQGYYQSALLYLLSSYLAAKKFIMSHASWTATISNKTV